MQTLCFDLTRRCNLACKFCARGPAQNQDISKAVIDATLDQMKDVFIWSLRFSGGEPLLNPTALEYVIDGIIKRNLAVCHITIFTNGTIYGNPQIDAALKRAADYLHTRNAEQTNPNYHKTVKHVYAVHGLVDIIVSEYGHLNAQHVDAAVNHYRHIGPFIEAVKQTSAYKGNNAAEGLVLYGSAIDHAQELVKQPVTPDNVPVAHNNEYSFIVQPGLLSYPVEPPHVTKSITVSTNGVVFPGCMKTYERVDAEADYNILDGEDLFAYLEEYCWQYPATKGMNKVKRKLLALLICRDKGLKVESDPDKEEIYKQVIDTYVARHHELHRQYPDADHLCVSIRCLCDLFDLLQEKGVDTTDDGVQWLSVGYTDEIRNSLKTAEGRKQLLDKLAYSVEHAEEIYMQNVTKYAIQQAAQNQIAKVMHDHPGIELLMEWFLPKHKPHSFSKH